MRHKNKKIYIFLVSILSLTVFSCSDDMLEKKPLNGYSEIDVFADEALLQNFVNGTYNALRTPFRDENTFTDGLTDNAYNQHGSADSWIRSYTRAEVSPDNGEGVTGNLWATNYSFIRRTNLFFEKTEGSQLNEDALNVMEGEMHFLRAYLYFDLLRWYGDVPLINSTFELGQESYDVSRNSIDEVTEFIVGECDLAIEKLLAKGEVAAGRASKEAALALKARTLLYAASPLFNEANDQEKWIAARDANKAAMEMSGLGLIDGGDEYGAMFRGEVMNEVIFARYYTEITNNQGWGVNLWLLPNSNGGWATTTPTQDLVDSYELITGELPSDPGSGYDDQNPYESRDPRFYETILFNGAPFKNATYDPFLDKADPSNAELAGKDSRLSGLSPHNASKTGYNFRKWVLEDKDEFSGNTQPYIFFRVSEFYLNYAETQLALNNEDEARRAINIVRERVGMPEVTATGDELVEAYRRERRVELVLEDHRFFDMRRWLLGREMLDKPATGVEVLSDNGDFEYSYDLTADNTRKWHDKLYFLPIPAAERQRSNGSLTQNEGY